MTPQLDFIEVPSWIIPHSYSIIYVDFPWLYPTRNKNTRFGLGMHRYKGLTPAQCYEFGDFVKYLAADNCALFMWHVPPKYVEYPLEKIMHAWGFRYATKAFTWIKISKAGIPRLLTGNYTGSNSEDCFLGIKGKMQVQNKGIRQVIMSQLDKHSRKPPEVRGRIVSLFGNLPRIELFATECILGWDVWGSAIDDKPEFQGIYTSGICDPPALILEP